jgi:5-methylcytosine-specific restriction endonuclease McrA
MLRRKVVEVIKYSDEFLKTYSKDLIQIPLVVRLLTFVRKLYKLKVTFTKNNLFTRDKKICAYCGEKIEEKFLSVDHIIPESRGGLITWENCVTSCMTCNNKKDDRTPNEARMFLKYKPYEPTIGEFTKLKMEQDGLLKFMEELFAEIF